MKTFRYFAAILLLILLAMTTSYALQTGDKAPDFKLMTVDGKTITLTGLRQGTAKLILVDFWSTSCDPCLAEIPHLQSFYQKYRNQGLVIVGIGGYRGDTFEDLKAFAKDNKMTYPIAFDADRSVSGKYGMWGLPTVFMIGKNGIVRDVHIGYSPPQSLESEIRALLK